MSDTERQELLQRTADFAATGAFELFKTSTIFDAMYLNPMGTVSTGPVLAGVIGFDGLLFGVPAVIAVAADDPLSWTAVGVQLAFGVLAVGVYLRLTTSPGRVELAESIREGEVRRG